MFRWLDMFFRSTTRFSNEPRPVPKPAPVEPEPTAVSGKAKLAATLGATAAAAALGIIATWEGKSNDPYLDLVNVKTVCFGETRVEMRRYSDEECEAMLADAVGEFGGAVLKRNPNLRDRPYQLAAATSLSYNIGQRAYSRSTVAKRFERGEYVSACNGFTAWRMAGGRVVQGLVNRRADERRLCLTDLEGAKP